MVESSGGKVLPANGNLFRPHGPHEVRRVVVVGASAGGVEALTQFVRGLPAGLDAAVLVVMHVAADVPSRLPDILDRAGPLPARHAVDGERVRAAHIAIAPPDRHMVVSRGRTWLVDGPRENRVRPAVDPLFRSAAATYGNRTIGVILSGQLDDGAAGMAEIADAGGTTIVQDPSDALASGMPSAAASQVDVDHVVAAGQIGRLIATLVDGSPAGSRPEVTERIGTSDDPYREVEREDEPDGLPSEFSCPECGGVLREANVRGVPRFRCRGGHGYTAESLLSGQTAALETALWAAVRALEEQAVTAGRLAMRAHDLGSGRSAALFAARKRDAVERADIVRGAMRSWPLQRDEIIARRSSGSVGEGGRSMTAPAAAGSTHNTGPMREGSVEWREHAGAVRDGG